MSIIYYIIYKYNVFCLSGRQNISYKFIGFTFDIVLIKTEKPMVILLSRSISLIIDDICTAAIKTINQWKLINLFITNYSSQTQNVYNIVIIDFTPEIRPFSSSIFILLNIFRSFPALLLNIYEIKIFVLYKNKNPNIIFRTFAIIIYLNGYIDVCADSKRV